MSPPHLRRYKLSKTFADTAGLGEIALQIKAEVEAFMPVMPLVTALRNPVRVRARARARARPLTLALTLTLTLT